MKKIVLTAGALAILGLMQSMAQSASVGAQTGSSSAPQTEVETAGKIKSGNKQIENGVVAGYKWIENGVVAGYKKVEAGVVAGYKKVEDKCVDVLFRKDDETTDEAKSRLNNLPK
jgi:hypothetical protein